MLKAYLFTALSQGSKIVLAFIIIKLIAMKLGPEGLGSLGNFMTLTSALVTFAGGGILTAVVKYTSEYKTNNLQLVRFLSAAFSYTTLCSLSILFIAILFSNQISNYIFNTTQYKYIIIFVFIAQVFYAYSNLIVGYITGSGNLKIFSVLSVISSVITMPLAAFLIFKFDFIGVTIALAMTNLVLFFPCLFYSIKTQIFTGVKFIIDKNEFVNLFKYSLMLISSAVFLPFAEIFVRSVIIEKIGLAPAGYFQALLKLSTVYTSFISLFLAYYYMPQISLTETASEIKAIAYKYLVGVLIGFLIFSIFIYILRFEVINFALSEKFYSSADYIVYQLISDLFKICAYVFGFIAVAKAQYKLYIGAEFLQSAVFCILTTIFISIGNNLLSIYKAMMMMNIIYFGIAFWTFIYYANRKFIFAKTN